MTWFKIIASILAGIFCIAVTLYQFGWVSALCTFGGACWLFNAWAIWWEKYS